MILKALVIGLNFCSSINVVAPIKVAQPFRDEYTSVVLISDSGGDAFWVDLGTKTHKRGPFVTLGLISICPMLAKSVKIVTNLVYLIFK